MSTPDERMRVAEAINLIAKITELTFGAEVEFTNPPGGKYLPFSKRDGFACDVISALGEAGWILQKA